MSPYTRPQLWVLLVITVLGGLGIAVGQWRRARLDVAERVDRFDVAYVGASAAASTPPSGAQTPSIGWRRGGAGVDIGPSAAAPAPPRHLRDRPRAPQRGPVPERHSRRSGPREEIEQPLDLNRATVHELDRLPGIGPALAQRILASRQQAGRFASVDDLRRVAGLGPARLGRLRGLVSVSE